MRRTTILAAGLAATAMLAACGDDEDDATAATNPPTTAETTDTTEAPPDDGGQEPAAIEIDAVDYAFEGLPATVEAGTTFRLHNHSSAELHEMVAFHLPAGEDRSLEELLALDQAELEGIVGAPRAVVVARPGEEGFVALGEATFGEPGRYLVLCAIPLGADPEEYLAAAEAAGGQPTGFDGPPHFTAGMVAEVVVE
jgi:uncharacterized cupredoxin-like copper-binding protein